MVVFVVYITPSIRAADLETLKEELTVEVGAARQAFKDPIIVVNGDFNHRDVGGTLNNVDDFHAVSTEPTRGDNTIDIVYTNVQQHINVNETRCLPPLRSNGGADSDHRCVYVDALFLPERNFKWVVKFRRTRDKSRERAFAADMTGWDWSGIGSGADTMADRLSEVIGKLTEKHFPLARVCKRSNESPWITTKIRKLWKRKIRIYRKGGRTDDWWATDRMLQTKIDESRESFVERLLDEGSQSRNFYSAAKRLASAAPPDRWEVSNLFPGLKPSEVCQEVLDFYGNISSAGIQQPPDIPRVEGGLSPFTVERTTELLRAAKKSDSRVDGDPLAHLVRCYPEAFAVPVAAIYNEVNDTGYWPTPWKTEHLTIIPKNPNPSGLTECRNISCTSIFSKILEGVVLEQLRGELIPDPKQYGGVPKCGTEHMLVDMWERVLASMEGGKNAAVLLGVDYEKAFNRMGHAECLRQLRKLGASEGSLALVRAFLENRRMTISINGEKAAVPFKSITRGSPQGSVLGCLLYCVTTQSLTDDLRRGPRSGVLPPG